MVNYLYGKLNKEVEQNDYIGIESESAKVEVDNTKNTIKVDVPEINKSTSTPTPNVLAKFNGMGNIETGVPTKPNEAVNKQYVDDTFVPNTELEKIIENTTNLTLQKAEASGEFDGVGISSIEQVITSTQTGGKNTYKITFTKELDPYMITLYNGAGITKAVIENGNLMITMSSTDTNGNIEESVINLGNIIGPKGDKGDKGDSVTITSINQSSASGGTSTVTFSDGKTLSVKNGLDGITPEAGVDYMSAEQMKTYIRDEILGGKW